MTTDRIEERLDRISDLQAEMNASLREHMRRTEIAEEHIQKINAELSPLRTHMITVQTIGKILTIVIASAGAVASIYKFIIQH